MSSNHISASIPGNEGPLDISGVNQVRSSPNTHSTAKDGMTDDRPSLFDREVQSCHNYHRYARTSSTGPKFNHRHRHNHHHNSSSLPSRKIAELSVDSKGYATVVQEPSADFMREDYSDGTNVSEVFDSWDPAYSHAMSENSNFYSSDLTFIHPDRSDSSIEPCPEDVESTFIDDPSCQADNTGPADPESNTQYGVFAIDPSLEYMSFFDAGAGTDNTPNNKGSDGVIANPNSSSSEKNNGNPISLPNLIDQTAYYRFRNMLFEHDHNPPEISYVDPKDIFRVPADIVTDEYGRPTIHRGLEHIYPSTITGVGSFVDGNMGQETLGSHEDSDSELFEISAKPYPHFVLLQSDESERCESLLLGRRKPFDEVFEGEHQKYCVEPTPPHACLPELAQCPAPETESWSLQDTQMIGGIMDGLDEEGSKSSGVAESTSKPGHALRDANLILSYEKPPSADHIRTDSLAKIQPRKHFKMPEKAYKELVKAIEEVFKADSLLSRYTLNRTDSKVRFCKRLSEKLNGALPDYLLDILIEDGNRELYSWLVYVAARKHRDMIVKSK